MSHILFGLRKTERFFFNELTKKSWWWFQFSKIFALTWGKWSNLMRWNHHLVPMVPGFWKPKTDRTSKWVWYRLQGIPRVRATQVALLFGWPNSGVVPTAGMIWILNSWRFRSRGRGKSSYSICCVFRWSSYISYINQWSSQQLHPNLVQTSLPDRISTVGILFNQFWVWARDLLHGQVFECGETRRLGTSNASIVASCF